MSTYLSSDREAKDLVLNLAQGSPREEPASSPQERHSPLQNRPLSNSHKYPPHPPPISTTILTPPSSSVPEDDFIDSNGAVAYPPPDYPSVFVPSFNADDSYYQQQEIFYPYSDPELAQHPVHVRGPIRPFSASSSSCSSSESDYPPTKLHLGPASVNPYYETVHHHGQHFNCFGGSPTATVPAHEGHQQQEVYGYDFKHHQLEHAPAPGYASVIVDAQQYQLANVH